MAGFNTLEMALIKAQQKAAEKAAKRAAKEAIGAKKILQEPTISIAESEVLKNTKYRQIEQALGTKTQPAETSHTNNWGRDVLGLTFEKPSWGGSYLRGGNVGKGNMKHIFEPNSTAISRSGPGVGVMGNLKGAWSGVLDWMDDGFKGGGKGIMPSIIGAGIGGTYGFVGNFFAPDNVQVQNPMRSALMGAAAGFGLGALGGAAGGVKAVNKANQGFMYHAANKTQKVAKGTTAAVAIGIAAYAGSKDTSYTKPLNRNSHI